jgi:hypothetical protein
MDGFEAQSLKPDVSFSCFHLSVAAHDAVQS